MLIVVPKGGFLLEYYLVSCSSWSVNKQFGRYAAANVRSAIIFEDILEQCITHFIGWVLFHVASIGTNGRRQMFYITFMNRFYGLSRDGIDINHNFGYGVSLSMYDTMKARHEYESTCNIQRKSLLSAIYWWDNFSKFSAHSIPTAIKGSYASCLWTGVTLNEYTGPEVDVSVKYMNNEVVTAMPNDMFVYASSVKEYIISLYDQGDTYLSNSLVHKYGVNDVPLMIDVNEFPQFGPIMVNDKNNTKKIHPFKLIKQNIGSNRGLLSILRSIHDDHKMDMYRICSRYVPLNVDENIYYRILKVVVLLL